MARRHRRARGPKFRASSEPDLTPLTDCVFLLLIFFMVSTTFIATKGISVDLPRGNGESRPTKDVNIVIDRDGVIQVNGQIAERETLAAKIRQEMKANNTRNAILEADRTVLNEVVVEVMDVARGEGIEGIAFVKPGPG